MKPTRLLTSQPFQHLLFYALASFIFYLAISPHSFPALSLRNDKSNHLVAFVTLALLLSQHRRLGNLGAFLSLAAYGLAIEVVQHFLPWRVFSLLDWLTDLAGIVIGLGVAAAIGYWLKRRRRH